MGRNRRWAVAMGLALGLAGAGLAQQEAFLSDMEGGGGGEEVVAGSEGGAVGPTEEVGSVEGASGYSGGTGAAAVGAAFAGTVSWMEQAQGTDGVLVGEMGEEGAAGAAGPVEGPLYPADVVAALDEEVAALEGAEGASGPQEETDQLAWAPPKTGSPSGDALSGSLGGLETIAGIAVEHSKTAEELDRRTGASAAARTAMEVGPELPGDLYRAAKTRVEQLQEATGFATKDRSHLDDAKKVKDAESSDRYMHQHGPYTADKHEGYARMKLWAKLHEAEKAVEAARGPGTEGYQDAMQRLLWARYELALERGDDVKAVEAELRQFMRERKRRMGI